MDVEVIEHEWIEMSDGCRLGARIWRPVDASVRPVPAILEYIPYRKRDGTRARDEPMHGFFAAAGYAAVRVDMRGSGESDGHMADEYLLQEQDDALEVIAWIARQPWCTGAVGMMGKSWGGFNALQVAARRPPALKAVISANSTDDRFADDIHYQGGCLLNDNHWWGAIMMAYQARPLDPAIVGPGWREAWLERIARLPFFPALWLAHQRRDAYWKHGSVCEDFAAVTCPVLLIGGWADSYTNTVPRLLEGLRVPRRAIVGPWAHVYPQDGTPGPAIDFLGEATRWWDRWLKGVENGVETEPMLIARLEDPVPPTGTRLQAPGRWVAEPVWPSPTIAARSLHLHADGRLGSGPGTTGHVAVRSPQSHGKAAGEWMGAGCPGEAPTDQRLDDGGAVLFDLGPLDADLDVLGAPVLRLRLASDRPVATLVARLSDIAPDGAATRVSWGCLNLTHRDGPEAPKPLEPGTFVEVTLTLNACGHRFAAGHGLRLALATTYWPMIWPAPSAATLTVDTSAARLDLPVRPRATGDEWRFDPQRHGRHAPRTQLDPGIVRRITQQDHVTGETTYVTEGVGGLFGEGINRFDETGTELSHSLRREMTIRDDDPLSARARIVQSYAMGRDGWRTRIDTVTEMTASATTFRMTGRLDAYEGETRVASRDFDVELPRDHL